MVNSAIQVPNATFPFVDEDRRITLPWRQFIAALFERTGGTSGGVSVPTGMITAYGGDTAPDGWLRCDGSAVSRSTYSNLFSVLGTIWGNGNGFDTFNLPDLTGKFPLGNVPTSPQDVGGYGGNDSVQLTTNQMPSHFHAITGFSHTHTITDPGHTHTVTDPGHLHNITDPGHTHNVTDPGHTHTAGADTVAGAGTEAVQGANDLDDINIKVAFTGVTIDSASTGITGTDTALAGITIEDAFTGITVDPATANAQTEPVGNGEAFSVLPPYAAVMYIIKT